MSWFRSTARTPGNWLRRSHRPPDAKIQPPSGLRLGRGGLPAHNSPGSSKGRTEGVVFPTGFSRSLQPSRIGDVDVSVQSNGASVTSAPTAFRRRMGLRLMQWAVNLWLVFHISAIIIAPASVAPSSDLVRSVWTLFQPYLQVLYL